MNKPHKKLDVWIHAIELARTIYEITEQFPPKEQFGLSSQMRRSAVSIASNIAEGAARQTKKEFLQFLYIAKGSLSELDTQLEIAKQLGYLNQGNWVTLDQQLERIDRMLSGLIRSLRTKGAQ